MPKKIDDELMARAVRLVNDTSLRLSRGFGCGAARERESACPVRKTLACDSRSFQQERHFQGEE